MSKDTPSNSDRADRAGDILAVYAETTGCEAESALVDLLTDLRHHADYERIDFNRAIALSQDHYLAERKDG